MSRLVYSTFFVVIVAIHHLRTEMTSPWFMSYLNILVNCKYSMLIVHFFVVMTLYIDNAFHFNCYWNRFQVSFFLTLCCEGRKKEESLFAVNLIINLYREGGEMRTECYAALQESWKIHYLWTNSVSNKKYVNSSWERVFESTILRLLVSEKVHPYRNIEHILC